MKDEIKVGTSPQTFNFTEILPVLLRQVAYGVLGILSTKGQVLGSLLPFGLSFVGGADTPYIAVSAFGVVAGYFLGSANHDVFRYIAASCAIAAIRLLVNGVIKKHIQPFAGALICGIVTLSTGIVMMKKETFNLISAAAEVMLAVGGAYFLSKASPLIRKRTSSLKTEELCSILISTAVMLSGFYSLGVGGISLGRVIAAFLILMAAKYGNLSIGAVCGISFGFMAVLCGGTADVLVFFSLGGMLAGVFAALGRYAQITVFILVAFISTVLGGNIESVIFIIEALLASAIFLLLPKNVGVAFGKILTPSVIASPIGIKKAVMLRLNFAADALCDVSQTVEQVSKELSKINAPDFSGVLTGVENDACKGCALRIHCWETKKSETVSAVLDMTKAVKNRELSPEEFAPEEFKGRCLRTSGVGSAVYRHYSDYTAKISAENRIDEVRGVVSDQFDGISSMLRDLAEEMQNGENFNAFLADAVISSLKNIDIRAKECSCKVDKYGRMSVEVRVKNPKGTVFNRLHIMQQVSLACDRDFDAPCITDIGSEVLITLNEKSILGVDIGVNQIACSAAAMCGDAYQYFYDGKGRIIMILSDGMGTGGRAAVDGAMASGLMSRLLKAGFGYDCSLRILNSSMLFKSTDESLATMDISVIDLFTGKTELLKAGAAPTIVRRSGKTGKAQSSSLPAGILREICFDKATIRLKRGDILLMMSDGAVSEGTEWICAELESWHDGTAQELSEHISECAKRRRSDKHEDDITVLAAIVKKAV